MLVVTKFYDACILGNCYSDQKILISKRLSHKIGGGFWEFPGGKIENNETLQEALIRELQEEVGLTPTVFKEFMQLNYAYPDYSVLLEVFLIHQFKGIAKGLEDQEIQWISKNEFPKYQFLEANASIIQALRSSLTGIVEIP